MYQSNSTATTGGKISVIKEKILSWMESTSETVRLLYGCKLKKGQVFGILLCGILLAFSVILATDSIREYGWAAFCLVLAIFSGKDGIASMLKDGR